MYYFNEQVTFDFFFNLENVGDCCKAWWVCVHQKIELYKKKYYYIIIGQIVMWKDWIAVFEVTVTAQIQNSSQHLSGR